MQKNSFSILKPDEHTEEELRIGGKTFPDNLSGNNLFHKIKS